MNRDNSLSHPRLCYALTVDATNPWDLHNDTLAYGEVPPQASSDACGQAVNATHLFSMASIAPLGSEEEANEASDFGASSNVTLVLCAENACQDAACNPFDGEHNVTQGFGDDGAAPPYAAAAMSTMPFRSVALALPFDDV